MNGVVSHGGYQQNRKVLLSPLVLEGFQGSDLGSFQGNDDGDSVTTTNVFQALHPPKEMIVVVAISVGTALQVFEVMPLRNLGSGMVIFRQGFIYDFTGLVNSMCLFGVFLVECRAESLQWNAKGIFLRFLRYCGTILVEEDVEGDSPCYTGDLSSVKMLQFVNMGIEMSTVKEDENGKEFVLLSTVRFANGDNPWFRESVCQDANTFATSRLTEVEADFTFVGFIWAAAVNCRTSSRLQMDWPVRSMFRWYGSHREKEKLGASPSTNNASAN